MTTYLCTFSLSPGVLIRVEVELDTENYGMAHLDVACSKLEKRLDADFLYFEESGCASAAGP